MFILLIILVIVSLTLDLHASQLLLQVLQVVKLNVRVVLLDTLPAILVTAVVLTGTLLLESCLDECLLLDACVLFLLTGLLGLKVSILPFLSLPGYLGYSAFFPANLDSASVEVALDVRLLGIIRRLLLLLDGHASEFLLKLIDYILILYKDKLMSMLP